jgi:hypothetical protein
MTLVTAVPPIVPAVAPVCLVSEIRHRLGRPSSPRSG